MIFTAWGGVFNKDSIHLPDKVRSNLSHEKESNLMKTLVIYDSIFGNTEKVAQAIATALDTTAQPVGQVTSVVLTDLDLLVIGSPSRSFRPT